MFLPLVNLFGSTLIFLGLVGAAPIETYHALARRMAPDTIIFFAVVAIICSAISIPIFLIAGGIVFAMRVRSMLHYKDPCPNPEKAGTPSETQYEIYNLQKWASYPLHLKSSRCTRNIVVMLTLSVDVAQPKLSRTVLAHVILFISAILHSALYYSAAPMLPELLASCRHSRHPPRCGLHSSLNRCPDRVERSGCSSQQRYCMT